MIRWFLSLTFFRGHNGPGGWILRDIPDEPNKTEFIWLLNTELKVWAFYYDDCWLGSWFPQIFISGRPLMFCWIWVNWLNNYNFWTPQAMQKLNCICVVALASSFMFTPYKKCDSISFTIAFQRENDIFPITHGTFIMRVCWTTTLERSLSSISQRFLTSCWIRCLKGTILLGAYTTFFKSSCFFWSI